MVSTSDSSRPGHHHLHALRRELVPGHGGGDGGVRLHPQGVRGGVVSVPEGNLRGDESEELPVASLGQGEALVRSPEPDEG